MLGELVEREVTTLEMAVVAAAATVVVVVAAVFVAFWHSTPGPNVFGLKKTSIPQIFDCFCKFFKKKVDEIFLIEATFSCI